MGKHDTGKMDGAEAKLSRRTFTKSSVAAGAAAVTLPGAVGAEALKESASAASGVTAAKRVTVPRRVVPLARMLRVDKGHRLP